MTELSKSAKNFQNYLEERSLPFSVVELPASTRSADDASRALACKKAQIVKSLVFRAKTADAPVIVLASGANQVDTAEISKIVGDEIEKPEAKFVKKRTGFSIGGVAPIGHKEDCFVCVDEDLLQYDAVWAAAGTPHAVFKIDCPITDILGQHTIVTLRKP